MLYNMHVILIDRSPSSQSDLYYYEMFNLYNVMQCVVFIGLNTASGLGPGVKLCKLQGCRRPVHEGYEFCGRSHGLQFTQISQSSGICLDIIASCMYNCVACMHVYCCCGSSDSYMNPCIQQVILVLVL